MTTEQVIAESESTSTSGRQWRFSLYFWRNGFVLLLVIFPLLSRAWFLSKVPEIEAPFDVDKFCQTKIVSGENAFDHYREAYRLNEADRIRRIGTAKPQDSQLLLQNIEAVTYKEWSVAADDLKAWLIDHREVLAEWRTGTECPDAEYVSLREMNYATLLPVIQAMRDFARMAKCEAARQQAEGDPVEAGNLYLAILRSSHHVSHRSVAIQGLVGCALVQFSAPDLGYWANRPELTADQLNPILEDVKRLNRNATPTSDLLKAEYIASINSLQRADWCRMTGLNERLTAFEPATSTALAAYHWILGEPKVAQRLSRHILANQLSEIDKPLAKRQPLVTSNNVMLFLPDPSISLKPRQLNPAEIDRGIQRSSVTKLILLSAKQVDDAMLRARCRMMTLELALAAQIYRRNHGEFPEDRAALVPMYLESWPLDPFDKSGQPMRYRRDNPQSAVVWSVGEDFNDAGGDVGDRLQRGADLGYLLGEPVFR